LVEGKSPAFRARASFSIEASWKNRSARAVSRRAIIRVLNESDATVCMAKSAGDFGE